MQHVACMTVVMALVLRWRRQGLTDSTRPEYRFVQESRIHPLGIGPKDLSEFGLLSKSIRLGDAMSLCCFSQEQQQQRQSALLGAGDRAFRVFGPTASGAWGLASCWLLVCLLLVSCWDARRPGSHAQHGKGEARGFKSACVLVVFTGFGLSCFHCSAGRRRGDGPKLHVVQVHTHYVQCGLNCDLSRSGGQMPDLDSCVTPN